MDKFILLVFLLLGNGILEKAEIVKTDATDKIIAGISTYRTELLEKKNTVVEKIGALIMQVERVEMKQAKREKLQKYLVRSLNTKECSAFFSQLAKKEITNKRYKEVIKKFEELELELVKINQAIINLKLIGLL